jgi:hypothetical protein
MTALTLLEASKAAAEAGDTHKAGVIATFAEKSDLLGAMPVTNIAGNALTFTQEGTLPTTAFRAINGSYTPNNGTLSPQTESLFAAGGELDVDVFIVKTQGPTARSKHEAMKIKALAVGITTQLISGANASDPTGFDGFQTRCTGSQLTDDGATSGGDVLSLTKLDAMIDSVDSPNYLLMSRAMRLLFAAAYRSSTFPNIYMEADETGKQRMSYGGLPILLGYPTNSNTKILPFTEANPGGGSAASSSIYALNLSEEGVCMIENGGMDVRDLGELDASPVYRTRVEWYVGLTFQTPYCAARLRGIKTGAIAA